MTLDIVKSEKEILAGFSAELRSTILQGGKNVRVKVHEPTHEKTDDLFVLFYAFYKDDAYARRLSIPTFREMHAAYQKKRKDTYLLFAYSDKMPIAVLWMIRESEQLTFRASGSITLGYELHAGVLVFWEAVKLGKKLRLKAVSFEPDSLFHGIIGL